MLRGGRLLVARRPTPLLISFFYIKTLHAFVRAVGHPPAPIPREKLISYLVAVCDSVYVGWQCRAKARYQEPDKGNWLSHSSCESLWLIAAWLL